MRILDWKKNVKKIIASYYYVIWFRSIITEYL
jgi:hypothetical protein